MKQNNTPATEVFATIRAQLLALPPDERQHVADELISFLLFDRKANATVSGKLGTPGTPGLTPEQLNLIRSLGDHTRDFRDLMGDDPYFFM
jgi:hypothetical protein